MVIDREKVLRKAEKEKSDWRECLAFLRRNHITKLRIFEYPDKDKQIVFAHTLIEHYVPGRLPTSSCVCRKKMFRQLCAFCTINKLVPRDISYVPFPTRKSFVINAMDTEEKIKWIGLYLIPYVVFNKIRSYVLDYRLQNILEFDSCRIFAIKSSGQGLGKRYTTELMEERAQPLFKKFKKQIVKPFRLIKDPGFNKQLEFLDDYLQYKSKELRYE